MKRLFAITVGIFFIKTVLGSRTAQSAGNVPSERPRFNLFSDFKMDIYIYSHIPTPEEKDV